MIIGKLWRPAGGILVGYTFLIIVDTLLIRRPFTGLHLNLELFWSWRAWSRQREQIIANVVAFIPVGVMAGWLWRWRGMLYAAGVSVFVEIMQLITSRGLCELDDVLHNCLGAMIGIAIVILVNMLRKHE